MTQFRLTTPRAVRLYAHRRGRYRPHMAPFVVYGDVLDGGALRMFTRRPWGTKPRKR